MLPSLLLVAPAVWLSASLSVLLQVCIAWVLQGPLHVLLPVITTNAPVYMVVGVALALLGNILLGVEVMQNQRTLTLFLTSFIVVVGVLLWLTGLMVHPMWLWGQGHWLAVPVAAVFIAGPCGTAAVIRMLHTETILETVLVLILFILLAAGSHWAVQAIL